MTVVDAAKANVSIATFYNTIIAINAANVTVAGDVRLQAVSVLT